MADTFQLKALITGVDQLSPKLQGIQKSVAKLRKSLKASGQGISILEAGAITAPFVLGARAAIEYESALADVRKVADIQAPQQLYRMSDEIRRLSTDYLPMASKEIAALYMAGASSGLANKDLEGFAKKSGEMAVAFGVTAEEAGAQMAAWRSGMKLTQEGAAELADQINYLDNKGNSAAKNVAKVVTAAGPLANLAGLSAGATAALAASMDAVKVDPDVAATGIQNLVLALTAGTSASKSQREMFKALRLDAKQLAKDMQRDGVGTVIDFFKRVASVSKDKQPAVLSETMGRESIKAIAPLLSNLPMLEENLRLVGDKAGYAGSMQEEFRIRTETTASRLTVFTNRVTDAGISLGDIMLPSVNDVVGGLGSVLKVVSAFTKAHPELVKTVVYGAGAYVGYRAAVQAAVGATNAFMGLARTNPLMMLVMALGAVAANWDKVAAAAGNAAAKNRLAIATADEAAVKGDPNSIRKQIEEMEVRRSRVGPERAQYVRQFEAQQRTMALQLAEDPQMRRRMQEGLAARMAQFDEEEKGIDETIATLKKVKANAERIQADDALDAQWRVRGGWRLPESLGGPTAEVTVNLNGAPPGTRVEPPATSNTRLTVNQNVGRRSLSPTSQ